VRRSLDTLGSAVMAFGEHELGVRIRSLLGSPARSAWNRSAVLGFLTVVALLALALSDPLHHFTETLLGLVLG